MVLVSVAPYLIVDRNEDEAVRDRSNSMECSCLTVYWLLNLCKVFAKFFWRVLRRVLDLYYVCAIVKTLRLSLTGLMIPKPLENSYYLCGKMGCHLKYKQTFSIPHLNVFKVFFPQLFVKTWQCWHLQICLLFIFTVTFLKYHPYFKVKIPRWLCIFIILLLSHLVDIVTLSKNLFWPPSFGVVVNCKIESNRMTCFFPPFFFSYLCGCVLSCFVIVLFLSENPNIPQ